MTEAGREKAARNVQEAEAARVMRKLWNPNAEPITDAVAALRQLAGSERHALDTLGELVNRWLEQDVTCEACGRPASEPPPVLLVALQRQDRQHGRTLGEMERLGIAGRAQELSESQAAVMFAIHQAVLELLHRELPGGLSVALRDMVVETVLAGIGRGPDVVLELEGGAS